MQFVVAKEQPRKSSTSTSCSCSCATPLQISTRNQLMVFSDWIRVKIFGRNLSDI